MQRWMRSAWGLALLLLSTGAAAAPAWDLVPAPERTAARSPLDTLLPGLLEERQRWAASAERSLERTLLELPEVVGARVHVALPPALPLDPDASRSPHSVAVMLRIQGALPVSEESLRRLVSHALPDLPAERVAITLVPVPAPQTAPALVQVGPLLVAAESRPLLLLATGGALTSLALLGGLAGWLALRRRSDIAPPG